MMQNLTLIIAQDDESAKRFRQLGALSSQIRVAGSLKWVINTPKPVATNMQVEQESTNSMTLKGLNRPIWIAASTHAGEEGIALAWQQQLLSDPKLANTLLIIVPRHPERFDEVAELIKATNLTMARRSLDEPITAQTQVYLADTMGELMHWYEQADVALVGGSLVDIGGHNPVEPASVATPVLMGQYTQSCQSVVDKLAEVGALYQPNNEFYQDRQQLLSQNSKSDALQKTSKSQSSNTSKSANSSDQAKIYSQLQLWLSDLSAAKRAGQAGAQLTSEQQAVLTQQLEMIETVISQSLQGVSGREVL
jgi:3-deoxy-D-manno-octulosonic-acid transferase